jgi:hypothetical protein
MLDGHRGGSLPSLHTRADVPTRQRAAGARSITINAKDPGSTGPLPPPPAGAGPNFPDIKIKVGCWKQPASRTELVVSVQV